MCNIIQKTEKLEHKKLKKSTEGILPSVLICRFSEYLKKLIIQSTRFYIIR